MWRSGKHSIGLFDPRFGGDVSLVEIGFQHGAEWGKIHYPRKISPLTSPPGWIEYQVHIRSKRLSG
jgi:hypothetical protein